MSLLSLSLSPVHNLSETFSFYHSFSYSISLSISSISLHISVCKSIILNISIVRIYNICFDCSLSLPLFLSFSYFSLSIPVLFVLALLHTVLIVSARPGSFRQYSVTILTKIVTFIVLYTLRIYAKNAL